MKEPRIQDIPMIRKTLEDVHNLEQLKRALPLLKPFRKLLKVPVEQLEGTLVEAAELASKVKALSELPDRFNHLFAPRGWIMYDDMDVQVALAAVAKAEAGDKEGAEQELVEYYNEELLGRSISRMVAVKAFRPRMPLARKALVDYLEGRYHASVPVVLMLLDGMVDDVGKTMGKNHGFFAKGVDLEAWNSIAAHSTGLAKLSKVLGEERTKTTTEQISMPYRHGILHGHDLGYDNKLVAAKAWAALLAARDWALKVERNEVRPQLEQPKPGWKEIFRTIQENGETKAQLAAWVARDIRPGQDIPASGSPEEYEDGTPEQKLAQYLSYWAARNYGNMARCLPYFDRRRHGKTAGELRESYKSKLLKGFELLEIRDEAPGITEVKAKLVYEEDGHRREQVTDFRLVNEDDEGNAAVRGKPGTVWAIYNIPRVFH